MAMLALALFFVGRADGSQCEYPPVFYDLELREGDTDNWPASGVLYALADPVNTDPHTYFFDADDGRHVNLRATTSVAHAGVWWGVLLLTACGPSDCAEQQLAAPPEQDLASDPDVMNFDPCESLTGTIDAETLVLSCETGEATPRTATYAVGPARDQLDTGG